MTDSKRSHLRLVYSRPDDAPEPDFFDFDANCFGSHDLDDYRIPLDPEPEEEPE